MRERKQDVCEKACHSLTHFSSCCCVTHIVLPVCVCVPVMLKCMFSGAWCRDRSLEGLPKCDSPAYDATAVADKHEIASWTLDPLLSIHKVTALPLLRGRNPSSCLSPQFKDEISFLSGGKVFRRKMPFRHLERKEILLNLFHNL